MGLSGTKRATDLQNEGGGVFFDKSVLTLLAGIVRVQIL